MGAIDAPVQVKKHGRFLVVRDDLLPGGTKGRFMPRLIEGAAEAVYAGPAWGGAAVSLALAGQRLGVPVTLFFAARAKLTQRQAYCQGLGARLMPIRPGYLSVVRSRAREYCRIRGARMLDWGLPEVEEWVKDLASQLEGSFSEVWVAAGSGTVLRGLTKAFSPLPVYGVEVGHVLSEAERGGAGTVRHSLPFERRTAAAVPFPSCRHYDAKAWEMAQRLAGERPLFWNVMGEVA